MAPIFVKNALIFILAAVNFLTTYQGCTDKSEPQASRALFIPHQLFFARNSSVWNGGVAFLDPRPSEETNTLGRAWLITREQFIEIMQQECGVEHIDCDWDEFLREKRFRHSEGWYNRLLFSKIIAKAIPSVPYRNYWAKESSRTIT